MTDKHTAALIRDLERFSRQAQAMALPTVPPDMVSALREAEKFGAELARALENPFYQELASALNPAAAWTEQMTQALSGNDERRVEELRKDAPAVIAPLDTAADSEKARLQAENARLEAALAAHEAAQQAQRPARQKGQKLGLETQRQAAIAFAERVDARRDTSRKKAGEEMPERDAVKAEIMNQGARKRREGKIVLVPCGELSSRELSHAVDDGLKRYARGKRYQAEDESDP